MSHPLRTYNRRRRYAQELAALNACVQFVVVTPKVRPVNLWLTSSDREFLRDDFGDRRFWPIGEEDR